MTLGPSSFGPLHRHVLDPGARTLRLDGVPVALGARALDVLIELAGAGGELCTKERLLQRCWPGLVVEEANLHVQVSRLRKLLGPEAIATVPGIGYRFAWPTRPIGGGAPPHNLPAPRTRFIGRETQLEQAAACLASTRLLTLIGIGGTGKTRLALRLAARALHGFEDGAWWVDLAVIDQPAQLGDAVARAMHVPPQTGRDAAQMLPGWLRQRRLLLVLDNCEHLLDSVSAVAQAWLAGAPGLKLLVTSREALGLPGELVLPVTPLTLPPAGAEPDAIWSCEAARVFVDRAATVAPGIEWSSVQAEDVAEICRRVDGIPLALELAAAQLRVVSPGQLRQLLQDRFRLLTSQRRALPRQQTMQAVIRWSYEHLSADEQVLLMALATCSGGCDLDAASALIGPAPPRVAVIAALSRLAEQSLLSVQHGSGPARYHLLETVRQFAFERLQERSKGPDLRARHVAHYLALAEECARQFAVNGEGAGPMSRLDAERDNLLRAIDACAHDDVPDAAVMEIRLLGALRRYWTSRGLANLGLGLSLTALGHAATLSATPGYRMLLAAAAYLLWWTGRNDEALARARELESLAMAAGDTSDLVLALMEQGTALRRLGRVDEGLQQLSAACRLALESGDRRLHGDALVRLGHQALYRGRLVEAARRFDEALPVRRSTGHAWRIVGVLLYSGCVQARLGDAARARALLSEAARLLPRVDSVQYELFLLEFALPLAALEGQWDVVAQVGANLHRMEPMSGPALLEDAQIQRAAALERARTALGEPGFAAAWARGRGSDLAQAVAFVNGWLGVGPVLQ